MLETRGIPHPAAVASLLAKLIRYDDETLTRGTSTPPWSRMERALEANSAEIDTAVKFSFDHPARLLTESIRTPLSFMGLQVDRTAIRHFLDAIATRNDSTRMSPGYYSPQAGRGPQRPGTAADGGDVVRAVRQGTERYDRWYAQRGHVWHDIARDPRSGEPFPRLAGYAGRGPEHSSARDEVQLRLVQEAEEALHDPNIYAMTVETITPERAEEYLAANRGNRNIVQSHVAAMARDIRNGQWMFNAQPICFSHAPAGC